MGKESAGLVKSWRSVIRKCKSNTDRALECSRYAIVRNTILRVARYKMRFPDSIS